MSLRSLYLDHERTFLGFSFIVGFFIVWEGLFFIFPINRAFLAPPSAIAPAFINTLQTGELYRDLYVSSVEFLTGLGLAVIVGIPLGLLMGRSKKLEYLLDPYVTSLYATPRITFIPLLILWFGIGIMSKVVIVFAGAVFPIMINTLVGVRQTDQLLLDVARSFGAKERQLLYKIILPAALPIIVTGLRLGTGRAILGVVVGEFFASAAGLGHMIARAGSAFQIDKLFVGLIILVGLSVAVTELIKSVEIRLAPWRGERFGKTY